MNISYIITRSDIVGGAHVHVRDLSLALLARGFGVTVLVGGEGPFTEELANKGVPYRSLRYLVRPIQVGHDSRALREVRSALLDLRPHLVSAHSSKAGWIGRLAGWLSGIPTIFTVHGWAFSDGVPPLKRFAYMQAEKLVARLPSRIITVSEYDRELALRHRLAPSHKLITVHNGMPDVPPVLRADPVRHPPRLAMVARFETQKDHFTLFRALADLRHLEWKVDLIGDGPVRALAEDMVRTMGLAHRIHFWGARKDVAEILAQAQGFLLISNWEGFPRSIIEAMRAGLPVVASDVGGVREAVIEGETGFLVPRGDVSTVRQRIEQLVSDPALRDRMGKAGRKHYEANFTFDCMFENTRAVYKAVLTEANACCKV